jgi:phytoene synthase
MNVDEAYRRCDQITRTEAKNFSYGIRLLPAPKRNAMSALYAYARRIDDIADSDRDVADKLDALAAVDEQVAALAAGILPDADDPVLVGVHHAAGAYPIPVPAISEIVEGCRRDSYGTGYATQADTVEYCRLVAGSVGRLSLGVFGSTDRKAPHLADELGVALQITNILRDIVEDREQLGRVYLPHELIARYGCEPDLTGPDDAMRTLIEHFVGAANGYYETGLGLLPLLDRRSRACVAAMAGIYRRLLQRVSLSTGEKLVVAGRSLAGISP